MITRKDTVEAISEHVEALCDLAKEQEEKGRAENKKQIQDPTPQRSDSAALCPICMPKRKSTAARSKLIETEYNVSVGSQASSIPFANDTIFNERSYGSRQQSRFELLTNLEKGEQSVDLGLLPSLRLSPPLVYHERKPSAIIHQEHGSDTTETKSHKSIISQRTKSVQFQFPLKNSIFGSSKSKKSLGDLPSLYRSFSCKDFG